MAPSSSADRPHAPALEPPVNSERAPQAARGIGVSPSRDPAEEQAEELPVAFDVEAYLRNFRGSSMDLPHTASTSSPLAEATLDECACPLPAPPVAANRSPHHEST